MRGRSGPAAGRTDAGTSPPPAGNGVQAPGAGAAPAPPAALAADRAPPAAPPGADADDGDRGMPYEQFIAERQRYVDARQRQQRRVDELVVGGAAGALGLSITFLEKIAPSPDPATRPLLLAAWGVLLAALGLSLAGHHASCAAFDAAIAEFDDCYDRAVPFQGGRNPAARRAARLARGGAVAFVLGVLLLAAFAFVNVRFVPRTTASSPAPVATHGRPPARPVSAPVPAARPASGALTAAPVAGLGQAH